jgi:hypothetical protein
MKRTSSGLIRTESGTLWSRRFARKLLPDVGGPMTSIVQIGANFLALLRRARFFKIRFSDAGGADVGCPLAISRSAGRERRKREEF